MMWALASAWFIATSIVLGVLVYGLVDNPDLPIDATRSHIVMLSQEPSTGSPILYKEAPATMQYEFCADREATAVLSTSFISVNSDVVRVVHYITLGVDIPNGCRTGELMFQLPTLLESGEWKFHMHFSVDDCDCQELDLVTPPFTVRER